MARETLSLDAGVKHVSVGCKLPNGLHLDLKNNSGTDVRVTLKGANDAHIVGGYGITPNVDAEFMTRWLDLNREHPAVIAGTIFIHKDVASVMGAAKERRNDCKTGLEAVDPLTNGMLRNGSGENDKDAVAAYNKQKAENPDRNRQRVE